MVCVPALPALATSVAIVLSVTGPAPAGCLLTIDRPDPIGHIDINDIPGLAGGPEELVGCSGTSRRLVIIQPAIERPLSTASPVGAIRTARNFRAEPHVRAPATAFAVRYPGFTSVYSSDRYTGFRKIYSGPQYPHQAGVYNGQRYAGFKKVYRGQRYTGFKKVYSGPRYQSGFAEKHRTRW